MIDSSTSSCDRNLSYGVLKRRDARFVVRDAECGMRNAGCAVRGARFVVRERGAFREKIKDQR